ncbi:MAG: aldehyde dehydrogenase family protein [Halochromatium sp.]
MLQKEYPLYLANRPDQPNTDLAVTHKFSGETATRVAQADAALVDRAIAAAVEAAGPMAAMAPYERRAVLDHCVRRFRERFDELASVQRILVHDSLAEAFEEKFIAATRELKSGDPADEDTFIDPMIDEAAAGRIESWIAEAREAGAELLCGGTREGALHAATVLKNVPRDQKLQREEAFGPVAIIDTFSDFDAALDQVNDSAYGIHAGVFTPRIDHAMQAWDRLDVGGVLINEVPSWRVDNLPYGGVKDSGLGREGVRYAMDDMTEIRSLVIRDIEPKAARGDTRPPRKTSIARARRANVPVSRETEKRRHIA